MTLPTALRLRRKYEIEDKIKKLRGEDYEIRLKVLNKIAPKLTLTQISFIYQSLQME